MRRFSKRWKSERGQSMVEYMLTISVIVVAVVAASYMGFIPTLDQGIKAFGSKYDTFFAASNRPN